MGKLDNRQLEALKPGSTKQPEIPPGMFQSATQSAATWRPIETAPKDGTRVLAYCPNHPDVGRLIKVTWWRRAEDGRGFIGWGEFNSDYWPPTHWMPLPEPPAHAGSER